MILANSTASAPLWGREAQRLRAALPADVQATLTRHETAVTTDSAEYREAMGEFYSRHVIRTDPMPDFVKRSFERIGQPYGVMWGPSEFYITGNLANWDRTARLNEINLPTLLISGEHDESTPLINQAMHNGIMHSQWILLEGCSHLAHVEEPERYLACVGEFLERSAPIGTQSG
jgi:L-proline amide hydrolase